MSDEWARALSVDNRGHVYVSGYTDGNLDGNTNVGSTDMFLAKYETTNGSKLWTQQLGTGNEDLGYDVSVDASGNAYVSGWTKGGLGGNNAGGADMFLVKISTVPEPGSLAMLAGIALTIIAFRGRNRD